jgi:hypothetical protein
VTVSQGLRLLRESRLLVAAGWCQGADARGRDGDEVDPWSERAVEWSVLGAIVAVLEREAKEFGEIPLDELASALYAMAEVIEADSLADWNDDPRRTQAEVVRAVQRAEDGFDPPHPEGAWFEPN